MPGEHGDRFYVVLSGLLNVGQAEARRAGACCGPATTSARWR